MVLVVAFCYLGHPKNLLIDWLIDWQWTRQKSYRAPMQVWLRLKPAVSLVISYQLIMQCPVNILCVACRALSVMLMTAINNVTAGLPATAYTKLLRVLPSRWLPMQLHVATHSSTRLQRWSIVNKIVMFMCNGEVGNLSMVKSFSAVFTGISWHFTHFMCFKIKWWWWWSTQNARSLTVRSLIQIFFL